LVLQFGGGFQYQQAASQSSQQAFAAQNAAESYAAAQAAAAQVTVLICNLSLSSITSYYSVYVILDLQLWTLSFHPSSPIK
jgi:hypothetical protein